MAAPVQLFLLLLLLLLFGVRGDENPCSGVLTNPESLCDPGVPCCCCCQLCLPADITLLRVRTIVDATGLPAIPTTDSTSTLRSRHVMLTDLDRSVTVVFVVVGVEVVAAGGGGAAAAAAGAGAVAVDSSVLATVTVCTVGGRGGEG